MNRIISRVLQLSLMVMLFPCLLTGQVTPQQEVSGKFENKALKEILDQLKNGRPLYFIYKETDLPQTQLSIEFQSITLDGALTQLLSSTNLAHVFYRDYAVIIAPKQIFEQVFSADYFKTLEEISTGLPPDEKEENVLIIGNREELSITGKGIVQGEVLDGQTGDPIIGATIFFPELEYGAVTDESGKFEIELPTGNHAAYIQYIGFEELNTRFSVFGDGAVTLELSKGAINLEEVLVLGEAPDANVANAQVSATKIDMKELKKLPVFLGEGEADIVKTLQLQAGVSSIGEGASGFNVRGGDVDQNLIMQDEGFIFNASHALGFFSTFNSDLIKGVTLYKSIIPAQYGGRLASVLDVSMRDGDFTKYRIKGGIGPITGRVTLEGPIIKNKASVILGFRSTYSDWVLKAVNIPDVQKSSSSFYDANLGYAHKFNEKNILNLAFYSSRDKFNFNEEFGFEYSTNMGQLGFENQFKENLFSKFSATISSYESTQSDFEGTDGSTLETGVSYLKIKEQLTYTSNQGLKIDVGGSAIFYRVQPGKLNPTGENSVVTSKTLENEQGIEWAGFANAEWEASPSLSISGGLRLAYYQNIGPGTAYQYTTGTLPQLETLVDSVQFSKGETIASYSSLEPRLSFRYQLNPRSSIKGGYSRTAQFINQISNLSSPTPINVWQLSSPNIRPKRSHNFSLGYFRNFSENQWESSLEVYYRIIDDLFDYRDFAVIAANEHIERELLPGIGRSKGVELTLRKKKGFLHGWFSYTLSNTEQKVEGINQGNWYNSNFDKTHDLSLVSIIELNQRHSISVNFNYNTGRPTTAPVGIVRTDDGFVIPVYSDRNQLRIPDYHRLDLAYTIGLGYNKNKKFKTSWTFSLYNVYGRKNAFSVFFEQQSFGKPTTQKFSVLGSVFPSITVNFQTI